MPQKLQIVKNNDALSELSPF